MSATDATATEPAPIALTYKSLRLPRGLLENLEEVIIQQDRLFLTEVGLHLGLTRAEIAPLIKRVLGTGATQSIPTLWGPVDVPEKCPWWECRGDGLWVKCPRHRIAPEYPCVLHERAVGCPLARIDSDPYIRRLPECEPIVFRRGGVDRLFWVCEAENLCFNEDGSTPTDGRIRFMFRTKRGVRKRVPVFVTYAVYALIEEVLAFR